MFSTATNGNTHITINTRESSAVTDLFAICHGTTARVFVIWASDTNTRWTYDIEDILALLTAGTAGQIANHAKRNATKTISVPVHPWLRTI